MRPIAHWTVVSSILTLLSLLALSQELKQTGPKPPPEQDYRLVTGTRVSLIVPQSFTPAATLTGFEDRANSSLILVLETKAPFSKLSEGYPKETGTGNGVGFKTRETVAIDSKAGILGYAIVEKSGTTFGQWTAIFGDETGTVSITAWFPVAFAEKLSTALRNSLLTARWDRTKGIDPYADLKFSVTESPLLKLSGRMSNILSYTKKEGPPVKSRGDPFSLVGQEVLTPSKAERKDFCEEYLAGTAKITNVSIEANKEIRLDGLEGCEVRGSGLEARTGIQLFVYALLLFDTDGTYVCIGRVGVTDKDTYLSEFEKMARSFRRKR